MTKPFDTWADMTHRCDFCISMGWKICPHLTKAQPADPMLPRDRDDGPNGREPMLPTTYESVIQAIVHAVANKESGEPARALWRGRMYQEWERMIQSMAIPSEWIDAHNGPHAAMFSGHRVSEDMFRRMLGIPPRPNDAG